MNFDGLNAYVVGLGTVLASLSPALFDLEDSFPLSTYPMFSHPRGQPWLDVVVGIEANGRTRPIEPRLVANGETLQAAAAISQAVRKGRAATSRLCETVAAAVAREPGLSEVTTVEVRAEKYDPVRYFTESATPLETRKRARCRVRR